MLLVGKWTNGGGRNGMARVDQAEAEYWKRLVWRGRGGEGWSGVFLRGGGGVVW